MRKSGNRNDEDRFRVRPGKPKQRGDTFISQVLRQTGKAANATGGKRGKAPGSRLGRGHVAARFTGQSLTAYSRRVTVKVRLVYLQQASGRSTIQHLRYIEREGVDRQGGPGRAYGPLTDEADTTAFEKRGQKDRHQFRFIVSPEDADQLEDLRTYMREGEVLSLLPTDVDLHRRQAWVRADNAKSGRARTVPLNDDAMQILSRRIPKAVTYVFERPSQRKSGTPIKICQTDSRDFKRACATVGIEDFHFHDLRHTWASWHVQSGTPLLVLKELGGWETLEMVQRYAHLAQSHLAYHAQNVTFLAHGAAQEELQPTEIVLSA